MGYNVNNIKKQNYAPLSCVKELAAIKDDVFKNVQHIGRNFEIVRLAFTEINKHYGLQTPRTICRSGCITNMNKTLKNWFRLWEASGGKVPKEGISIPGLDSKSGDTLQPLDSRREELTKTDWVILKERAIELLSPELYKSLNNGKPPKKAVLIEELLKL